MAPAPFRLKIGGVDASVVAEVNASFLVDIKKVGAEIGKKIVVRAGVKMLEREAAQQGLKVLSGHAARAVLKDLGPLAAAFGVGWDLGEVLNAYKVAPEAAGSHRESQSRPSRRRETNSSKPLSTRLDGRVAPFRAPRSVPHRGQTPEPVRAASPPAAGLHPKPGSASGRARRSNRRRAATG